MTPPKLTVSQINHYIKHLLESDPLLDDIWILGEISNLRVYHLGHHVYFNLIESNSQMNCVVYETFLERLPVLENGMQVAVRGKVKVFHRKGSYTFQVAYVQPIGAGPQSMAFYKLKERLHNEGLFEPSAKKELPAFPKRIGLITAKDSAALADFCQVFRSEVKCCQLYLFAATMQGPACPQSVIDALHHADDSGVDVVAVIRGGGGSEDLMWFNDEMLVRTIACLHTPVLTAIGHDTDTTLADLAADVATPTPTAAAHRLAQPFVEAKGRVRSHMQHLSLRLTAQVDRLHHTLLADIHHLDYLVTAQHAQWASRIHALAHRVELANPLSKLRQGYSITRRQNSGAVLRSVQHVGIGDSLNTEWIDGHVISQVTQRYEN
jgi:exodeoxyribonuclease VII large subunit